jgi:hypothetical protein
VDARISAVILAILVFSIVSQIVAAQQQPQQLQPLHRVII